MTTVEKVKVIIETTLTDPIIQGYINGADIFLLSALSANMPATDLFDEIETWFVAHMIASTKERMAAKEEAGGAKIEYVGSTGSGISSTPYGQMALVLDTSGELSLLDAGKKKARVYAIPTT